MYHCTTNMILHMPTWYFMFALCGVYRQRGKDRDLPSALMRRRIWSRYTLMSLCIRWYKWFAYLFIIKLIFYIYKICFLLQEMFWAPSVAIKMKWRNVLRRGKQKHHCNIKCLCCQNNVSFYGWQSISAPIKTFYLVLIQSSVLDSTDRGQCIKAQKSLTTRNPSAGNEGNSEAICPPLTITVEWTCWLRRHADSGPVINWECVWPQLWAVASWAVWLVPVETGIWERPDRNEGRNTQHQQFHMALLSRSLYLTDHHYLFFFYKYRFPSFSVL